MQPCASPVLEFFVIGFEAQVLLESKRDGSNESAACGGGGPGDGARAQQAKELEKGQLAHRYGVPLALILWATPLILENVMFYEVLDT